MTKANETQVAVIETLAPVKYEVTKAALAKLKRQCGTFKEAPTNPADYKKLTTQIALVRTTRTSIEKRRKELKAPLIEYGKKVDGLAKELAATLQGLETPLVNLKMEADAEKAREKEAQANAERERLQALNDRLTELKNRVYEVHTIDEVTQAIEHMAEMVIEPDKYQELAPLAEMARQESLMKLRQKAAALEADRIADEQRQQELAEIETRREAQAKIDAEQAERQAAMDKQQAALDKQAADQAEKEAQAQAEADRLEREAQEKAAAEKLEKEQAAQARKAKAYQKKLVPEIKLVRNWLAEMTDVITPQAKLDETSQVMTDVVRAMAVARETLDGLQGQGNE